jgi:hypothetical protein
VVKLLLEKSTDVNAQSVGLDYALYAASAGVYETVVMLLLDKGTDVNRIRG